MHEGVGVVGRNDAPIGKDWRFNCASITKMFVATVVFHLEEEGKLSLHDINRYELNRKTYWGHGGFYGSLLLHDPVEGVTLVANISQAVAPFAAAAVVGKILTIVGAK